MEIAWAKVEADATPSILVGKNMASVTRNGAGDYTLNFSDDIVQNGVNYGVFATVDSTDAATLYHIDAAAVNDRSIRVRTNVTGAGTDVNFSAHVIAHRAGNP